MFFPNKSPGHLNMKTLQNKSVMINDKLSLFWHLIHLNTSFSFLSRVGAVESTIFVSQATESQICLLSNIK